MKVLCLMVRKLCAAKLKFSKCRSKVTVMWSKLWYHKKGLVIRNTHAKYESPISKGKKVIGKQKVWQSFLNVGKRSRSRSHAQNLCFHRKGLIIRNPHAKYESPISKGKKVISKPKVWQTDRQTDGRTDRRTTDKVIPKWRSALLAPQKQGKAKRDGVIYPQNYNFNEF